MQFICRQQVKHMEKHKQNLNIYKWQIIRIAFSSLHSHGGPNPVPHLELYLSEKKGKKNDLSPRLIMRLREAFISIASVCSPTVYWGVALNDVFTPATIL